MDQVLSKYDVLKKTWDGGKYDKVGPMLDEMKKVLTVVSASFLPLGSDTDQKCLLVTRDVMEIGALYSVHVKDVPAFERYMARLKTYYCDYADLLSDSAKKYELLGLNLLCLLSQNRTSDFHTELELLPAQAILDNPYISCPVRLEQFIMEGKYNKIKEIKDNVPSKWFKYFIEILLITIRTEIASCMEKAYEEISAEECKKMLDVDAAGLSQVVKERDWHHNKKGVITFISEEEKKAAGTLEIPARELAEMAISYAKEMEQIV